MTEPPSGTPEATGAIIGNQPVSNPERQAIYREERRVHEHDWQPTEIRVNGPLGTNETVHYTCSDPDCDVYKTVAPDGSEAIHHPRDPEEPQVHHPEVELPQDLPDWVGKDQGDQP